jgi:hypothetical protein
MLDPIHAIRLRTVFGAAAAALLVIGLVAGCGGGAADDAPAATAGAASYAQGPITGFGSVIVDGVRFDDSSASITDDDGASATSSALKLGAVVEIDASAIDDDKSTAKALRIRFGSEIVGPVSAVDTAASTLTVLGQTVEVKPTTVFGDGLAGGLGAIAAGTVVEVNALFDASTGRYVATRIEADPSAPVFKLRGLVAGLDTFVKTFTIGGATISYASVADADLPAGFDNGMRVRVRLQKTQVNGQWVAISIRAGVRKVEDHDRAHLHGSITAFVSASQFSVDGVAVDASAASFPQGSGGLALGVEVNVQGRMAGGVLLARRVEIVGHGPADHPIELHGALSSLDGAAQTFMLRGVVVDYGGAAFSGGTEADLANGRKVEVKGQLSGDHLKLIATRIEFAP